MGFPGTISLWFLLSENLFAGVPMREPLLDHRLYTDTPLQGWGAHLDNQLEMKAVYPAVTMTGTFLSLFPDEKAWAVDVCLSWAGMNAYLFPQVALLGIIGRDGSLHTNCTTVAK